MSGELHEHQWLPGLKGRIWRCKCGATAIRVTSAKSPPQPWYRSKWAFAAYSILGVLFVYWIAR